jgi:Mrp family chromosome partitioning ATPase
LSTVESILREARESYDLVVVDSAPVLAAPEAFSICQMTDGVILAVRWGHTRYRQVRYAASMLRSVNANLLGAVVTRADVRKHSLYGFGDVGDVYRRYAGYHRA